MPVNVLPNCGTQLERAIRAYLIAQGAGTADDIYISNDSRTRAGLDTGLTDIMAVRSRVEGQELSGNEVWQVTLENKFGASPQPGQADINLNRVQMDLRVGKQMYQMLQADDSSPNTLKHTCAAISAAGRALAVDASNGADPDQAQVAEDNADMVDFTCIFLRFLGSERGHPKDHSTAWVEKRIFEITACPANVD
jgi:hypothetical protein